MDLEVVDILAQESAKPLVKVMQSHGWSMVLNRRDREGNDASRTVYLLRIPLLTLVDIKLLVWATVHKVRRQLWNFPPH